MRRVTIEHGENLFNELVDAAVNGEPQFITQDGKTVAVLLTYREYARLTAKKGSLSELLLSAPLCGAELDLTRDKDPGRPTIDLS